ncbi:MAG: DUF484 family protein [Candidatus Polarisedimenticolaceae bacterium]|nr:DUF484 family protein [Candidatus Polarisedimenticolaceae bacterium]
MTSQRQETLQPTAESESSVAAYLGDHPDFFERHAELLENLQVPHASGGAISLVERQIANLRRQSGHYRDQLNELIVVARENDQLQSRLHQLTLSLIESRSYDELIETLRSTLSAEFHANSVELRLFSPTGQQAEAGDDEAYAAFEHFFTQGEPLCGRLKRVQLQLLFADQADQIKSTALVPLKHGDIMGLLAIGSQDPDRYHSGQSTDYLKNIGEVICRVLQLVATPGI